MNENAQRSNRAGAAILAYLAVGGGDVDSSEDTLTDLFADLLHWGSQWPDVVDVTACLRRAEAHFTAEQ